MLFEFGRKEARASTISKTAETAKRQREREARARRLLKKKLRSKGKEKEDSQLSQEELLEEAKLTEKLNLASLKRYEEMELEAKKKAVKIMNKAIKGPFIRYLSTAMPKVQVLRPHLRPLCWRQHGAALRISRFQDKQLNASFLISR